MTKEEAIQILSTRDKYGVPCGYTSGYQEALDMAIEALQKEAERQERVIRASERFLGIVRCKDCRYCTEYYDRDGYPYWECAEWDSGTGADGFCHYGERREKGYISLTFTAKTRCKLPLTA